ncbi:MAG: MASE1 domain-containing protein [Candidatus Heimdallarchaeota archaeon]|nr:MASE1 domain-containing protein [Candidatus Heimdallarchaeota archaeon]
MIDSSQVKQRIWVYLFFTILYQIAVGISQSAIHYSQISWFYLPPAIVLAFYLFYGSDIAIIFFPNVLYSYLYIWDYFEFEGSLYASLIKVFNYTVVVFIAKRVFKTESSMLAPVDFIKYYAFGSLISFLNALFSIEILLDLPPLSFIEYTYFVVMWVLGDVLGEIFLLPLFILVIFPYLSYHYKNSLHLTKMKQIEYITHKTVKKLKRLILNRNAPLVIIGILGISSLPFFLITIETIHYDFLFVVIMPVFLISVFYRYKITVLTNFVLNIAFFITATQRASFLSTEGDVLAFQLLLLVINFTSLLFTLILNNLREENDKRLTAEKQLSQMKKLNEIGRLTARISHDFKNVVQIMSFLTDASLESDDVVDIKDNLGELRKQIDAAMASLNQLLSTSQQKEFELYKLGDLICEMKSELQTVVGSIELNIENNSTSEVIIDENSMKQILVNLLLNSRYAVEQNANGGGVTIQITDVIYLETKSFPSVNVPAGKYVLLEIHDDGIGIPEEHMEKLFNLSFSTKESSGMGLFSVLSIVLSLDAYINVESELGKWTKFSIWFVAV